MKFKLLFCIGKNVELNSELFQRILHAGHAVGNHTMFHERGWHSTTSQYIESVIQAKKTSIHRSLGLHMVHSPSVNLKN